MGIVRPALPFGEWVFEFDLRRAERALTALLLALVLATTLTSTGGSPSWRATPASQPQGASALAALSPAAQASISAVLGRDDPRYHAAPAAGGRLAATNPRHGLEAAFAQDGVTVRTGAGLLSLSLQSAGYGPALQRVAAASPTSRANRIEYRRGPLTEWYVNGPLGLEQGFTLAARPTPRAAGPLSLRLRLGGTLASAAEGNDVVFGRALRYRGLAAWDSAGRALPASLGLSGHSLTLQIDDRGARYPVTIDPFLEQATLQAAGGVAGDELGTSVAVSGDTIVVGAVADDGLRGSAYVFVEPASGWAGVLAESAKLTASDGTAGDAFGTSVAASGNTIVVGAYGDDGMRGAAYVFVKPPAGWAGNLGESGKLTASVRTAGALFGLAVGVDGDTAVAGAHGEAGGAAYVFVKPGTGWAGSLTQSARLTPAAGGAGTLFGWAVAVSGSTVAVGAYGEGSSRGAVYVFGKPAAGWSGAVNESAKLAASAAAAGDGLGFSVAASGTIVVAGAPYDDAFSGSAYVFERPGAGWSGLLTERARLRASAGTTSAELGVSVAVSGDVVAAGSWGDDAFAGAVYMFTKPGGGWAGTLDQTERLTAADAQAGDGLGGSVGLDAGTLAAGASADNGDRGSARVFGTDASGGDTTAPVTTIALTPAGPDGQNGWYRSAVHVSVAASDASSVPELRCVLDPATAPATFADLPSACPFPGAGAPVTTNGTHTVYAASRDSAGNAGAPVSAAFKIDRTAPVVTCSAAPTFVLGGAGGMVGAVVTDSTSGPLASPVSTPADVSSAGWKWASLTGADRAGNSTNVSCGYLVGYAVLLDPAFPRRPPGTNAGAAVPVRFALTDAAGSPIADAAAQALAAACSVRVRLDGGTPGCARYDATAHRFEYVLKTPKTLAPGTHTVTIEVLFGSGVSATDVPFVVKA